MMKRQVNRLKFVARLLVYKETTDPETDRPIKDYIFEREIRYQNMGVTATDKIIADRETNDVVKKIEIRMDRKIEDNQKIYRIEIRDKKYNIERIYTREEDKVMEVSLSYAG
ncbi:phage head closure protein [Enterococcus cecorum]|uniref:head-tail adaptor protein n=2 Tax=Enterococcus cecorum TaxID=44008 RepID=UPI000AA0F268|nr:phage head closure protein [Enterococcus cecorum]